MDRYIKTVLTVIAGCLLVLVGAQVDFPAKAYAEISAAGHSDTNGGLVAVTEQGRFTFTTPKQMIFISALEVSVRKSSTIDLNARKGGECIHTPSYLERQALP